MDPPSWSVFSTPKWCFNERSSTWKASILLCFSSDKCPKLGYLECICSSSNYWQLKATNSDMDQLSYSWRHDVQCVSNIAYPYGFSIPTSVIYLIYFNKWGNSFISASLTGQDIILRDPNYTSLALILSLRSAVLTWSPNISNRIRSLSFAG